jgi:hypothetical protein
MVYLYKPKTKNVGMALWNALAPYDKTIWLLLLIALCLQFCFASLVAKAEHHLKLEDKFMPFYVRFYLLKSQFLYRNLGNFFECNSANRWNFSHLLSCLLET